MPDYQLVTNSVTPSQVRETESAYVIEDVPFVRPMDLAGGYVPEASIADTIDQWDGVPVTLNHPRNGRGEPVAANRQPETHLGIVEDPYYDGEVARADVVVDKGRLDVVDGASTVREKLEREEPVDVSSQYAAQDLPAGEYDGQIRENVEAITRPDSLAILPDKRGRCSIEDGCGIDPKMVANAEVHVPMTRANATHDGEDMDAAAAGFDAGDRVRWTFGGDPAFGRVVEVFDTPGETITRTIKGTEVTREVTEDEAAYLVETWRDDAEAFEGAALKSGSELSEWEDPPDAAMSSNATTYEVTNVTAEEVDEFTDEEWDGDAAVAAMPNPSEDPDAADALDRTHMAVPANDEARDSKANWKLPFRVGPDAPVNTRALVAIDAALSGARDGVEGISEGVRADISERVQAMLDAAPDDLFGSMSEQEANALTALGRQVLAAMPDMPTLTASADQTTNSTATTPAESGVERDRLVEDITAHSDLSEATLSGRCMDGLEAIHDDVVPTDDGADTDTTEGTMPDDDTNDSDTTSNSDDTIGLDDLSDEAREAIVDEAVERIEANSKDSEKEELAQEIVANSAEYDDTAAVREDYPTAAALETKRDAVAETGGVPPAGQMEANLGDGIDVDVGSGVLTE